jgi:nucleoid DNA-binding protein
MTHNKVMHKRQLVDEVARRSGPWGLTGREVCDALHSILDVITDQMAEGNAVTVAGFGRFEAKEHKGRRVVGLDGEEYEVGTRLVPSFHPYDSLRQKVQGKMGERLTPKPGKVPLRWSDDPSS